MKVVFDSGRTVQYPAASTLAKEAEARLHNYTGEEAPDEAARKAYRAAAAKKATANRAKLDDMMPAARGSRRAARRRR